MRDAKCCPGAFRGIDLSSLRKQFDQEMQIQGNAAQYVISVLNGLMEEDENNNFLSLDKRLLDLGLAENDLKDVSTNLQRLVTEQRRMGKTLTADTWNHDSSQKARMIKFIQKVEQRIGGDVAKTEISDKLKLLIETIVELRKSQDESLKESMIRLRSDVQLDTILKFFFKKLNEKFQSNDIVQDRFTTKLLPRIKELVNLKEEINKTKTRIVRGEFEYHKKLGTINMRQGDPNASPFRTDYTIATSEGRKDKQTLDQLYRTQSDAEAKFRRVVVDLTQREALTKTTKGLTEHYAPLVTATLFQ